MKLGPLITALLFACIALPANLECTGPRAFPLPSIADVPLVNAVPLSIKSRIHYYLGNVKQRRRISLFEEARMGHFAAFYMDDAVSDCLIARATRGRDSASPDHYVHSAANGNLDYFREMAAYLRAYRAEYGSSVGVLMTPNDVAHGVHFPALTKSRPADLTTPMNRNVLMLLTAQRHLAPISAAAAADTPHAAKRAAVVWRGATTGPCTRTLGRCQLVTRWAGAADRGIDVSLTKVTANVAARWPADRDWGALVGTQLSTGDLLGFKYVVVAEGNDVATSLKWALYSNSTVFMARPRIASWFMEDVLVPWVHYVPLEDDYCDLEEKYGWCLQHPAVCEGIAINGQSHIRQFLDAGHELKVIVQLLREYSRLVRFRVTSPRMLCGTACNLTHVRGGGVDNVEMHTEAYRYEIESSGGASLPGYRCDIPTS